MPTTNRLLWPNFSLAYSRDVQYVDCSGNELDVSWQQQDAAGHWHFVAKDKTGSDRLPTLTWVSEECSMGHGDDCDSEGRYLCPLCQEEVKPRVVWRERQEAIPGPTEITLTETQESANSSRVITYWVSPENVREIEEAIATKVHELLAGQILDQHMESWA